MKSKSRILKHLQSALLFFGIALMSIAAVSQNSEPLNITCILRSNSKTYASSAPLLVNIGLKNDSLHKIGYEFGYPQFDVNLELLDSSGKRIGCDANVAHSTGTAQPYYTIEPGKEYLHTVDLKDWSCPHLAPGRYKLSAVWNWFLPSPDRKVVGNTVTGGVDILVPLRSQPMDMTVVP